MAEEMMLSKELVEGVNGIVSMLQMSNQIQQQIVQQQQYLAQLQEQGNQLQQQIVTLTKQRAELEQDRNQIAYDTMAVHRDGVEVQKQAVEVQRMQMQTVFVQGEDGKLVRQEVSQADYYNRGFADQAIGTFNPTPAYTEPQVYDATNMNKYGGSSQDMPNTNVSIKRNGGFER